MGQNPPGPQPYLFHCIWENKTWEGPERGGIGILCRRCTRQSRLQQVACTLVHLTRGEESSLLLHEPPQLGAAPPTHLIGWGSMHFDCYGPNKCGCVTISMPNPFRDRGPTCALGHRGRAPNIYTYMFVDLLMSIYNCPRASPEPPTSDRCCLTAARVRGVGTT